MPLLGVFRAIKRLYPEKCHDRRKAGRVAVAFSAVLRGPAFCSAGNNMYENQQA